MSMLRKALEDDTKAAEPTIVMKGPLSDIYTQALSIAYSKDAPPEENSADQTEVALEAASNKKTKKPLKLKVKKGKFHEWLGKKEGEPITDADIAKGLKSDDPHVRKMAQFAKNAKKFHHTKHGGGSAMESFDITAFGKYIMESQQMDVAIMQEMATAAMQDDAAPTDNFQTVYGVSKDSIDETTVVEVTNELANNSDNSEFILIIDATTPGDNGETDSAPTERMIDLTKALECMVTAHNGKVFTSLKSFAESRK